MPEIVVEKNGHRTIPYVGSSKCYMLSMFLLRVITCRLALKMHPNIYFSTNVFRSR